MGPRLRCTLASCGLTSWDLYAISLVLDKQFHKWRPNRHSILFDSVEIEFIWVLQDQSRPDVSSTPRYLWTRVGSSGTPDVSHDVNSEFFLCDMRITYHFDRLKMNVIDLSCALPDVE